MRSSTRTDCGIVAGLRATAAAAYHWYTTQILDITSTVSDPTTPENRRENETLDVGVPVQMEPESLAIIPVREIETEIANLMADVVRLNFEKVELVSQHEALVDHLREESLQRENLQAENANLRAQLDQQQSEIEKVRTDELENYRTRQNSALTELQMDYAHLRVRIELATADLENITVERDQLAAKVKAQKSKIFQLRSNLENARAETEDAASKAVAYHDDFLQALFQLEFYKMKITQMETMDDQNNALVGRMELAAIELDKITIERDDLAERNGVQETRIRRLQSDLQDAQADAMEIANKSISYQCDLLKAHNQLELFKIKTGQMQTLVDEQTKRIVELELEKSQHCCDSIANVPLGEKVTDFEFEQPSFASWDDHFKDEPTESLSVIPELDEGGKTESSLQQDCADKVKPAAAAFVEPEPFYDALCCDEFKVLDKYVEQDLPDKYILSNIPSSYYAQILGKHGKNITDLEKMHNVTIVTSLPVKPKVPLEILIKGGFNNSRLVAAKTILGSLPAIVEVAATSLGPLTAVQRKQFWSKYRVEVFGDGSNGRYNLRGNLANCKQLFREQRLKQQA